ncbi:hypothetical protein An18g05580 [Aspergillus niger]|uniref:Uncharacterized protein n=2 Tax=Aspergillus niger TaxID=5061 RepID=A2RB56_ASPNC|nr:hypothetical protein An18g05580 [Aspergillus niger]CAK97476.1 hypothetical protein An18g05580 [Aspergillus niger]
MAPSAREAENWRTRGLSQQAAYGRIHQRYFDYLRRRCSSPQFWRRGFRCKQRQHIMHRRAALEVSLNVFLSASSVSNTLSSFSAIPPSRCRMVVRNRPQKCCLRSGSRLGSSTAFSNLSSSPRFF